VCTTCLAGFKGKGKPQVGDEVSPEAQQQQLPPGTPVAAPPPGSPFAGLVEWAVYGHDENGVGLSVAGCRACNPSLPDPVMNPPFPQGGWTGAAAAAASSGGDK
jgi:hypothetical protein